MLSNLFMINCNAGWWKIHENYKHIKYAKTSLTDNNFQTKQNSNE